VEELKKRALAWKQILGKYKYTVLILAIGLVLLCLPIGENDKSEITLPPQIDTSADDLTQRIENLLAQIDGVGDVQVALTLENGTSRELQQNTRVKTTTDGSEIEKDAVLISVASDEMPIEIASTYPTYRGAVVVCQGADRASVKLDVVRAVSSLTGLGSDRIAVIKMKR